MPSGITIQASPPAYTPVYSPAWFTAISSNVAAANFKYRVKITDVLTSQVIQRDYDPDPSNSNKLVLDTNAFAEEFVKNFVPNNQYGWKLCTDAIRQIKVNIGEYYGTTPAYTAGSDQYYLVWNGSLSELQWPDYLLTDYVYKSSTSNWKFISSYNFSAFTPRYKLNNRAYTDKSSFIYCLSSEADDMEAIRIKCYDSSGSLIQSSIIANPFSGTTTYTNQYVCIDVGRKGLDNISSGLVTGTYPIIPSNCDYYEIEDVGISGEEPPFTYTLRKIIQRLYISCEAKYDVYTVHYLSQAGNFETVHFPKVSSMDNVSEKTSFNQNPFALNASNVNTYTKFTLREKVVNASYEERLTLQTDWLTYEEIAAHKEIIDSPVVYIDYGSTIGLIPVMVETNSYKIRKKFNTGEPAFQITVKKGFKNSKQRG